MFVSSRNSASLSSVSIVDFNTLIVSLIRRLLRTVSFLVMLHVRNTQSEDPPTVTVADVRTAVDILGLPRHFQTHFQTLPRRMDPFGVRCTGSKTIYWNTHPMKEGEIQSLDVAEAVLMDKTSGRRRVDSKVPWPEEWDVHRGFNWKTQVAQPDGDFLKTDSEMENPQRFVTTEAISEFQVQDTSPAGRRRRPKVDMDQEEDVLLNAETAYLDALDTQQGKLELGWLTRYMKDGVTRARRWKKEASKSLTSNEETRTAKNKWGKIRKRFMAKFGEDWCCYPWDGVTVEGTDWEQPPQEWKLFQKET